MSKSQSQHMKAPVEIEPSGDEPTHIALGQDGNAQHHYVNTETGILRVIHEDGTITHTEDWGDIDGTLDTVLAEWIAFVDERRGWLRREYITATEFGSLENGFRTLGEILEQREQEESR